ncbi:SEC-C metal-binding domain-containing protein [Clostridium cylindrosporum]|uniref:Preprotein translocase subunit SecA n=1 Tax=Clostridium cylindrosporum DSM 605 TaxID=1121307 RepID=A0A0J8DAQ1_CLOCY|nr:SEC-C metal-binding domain-containing protein [Clostridium cylindrosporum]KMT23120.1 preprotein translocase subunit SecA [Clostridium cylindrosporum DSM 605]
MEKDIMEIELQKIKSKLLSPIREDYNLKDFLNNMTKDELISIRKTLGVKGTSSFTKPQLIERLNEVIKESIPDILHNITEKEYYMLLIMIPKNGITLINLEDKNQLEMIVSLRNWGIVYTGKINDMLFASIPRDIFGDIKTSIEDKNVSDSISNRQKWLRAVSGLLYFYGALEKEELYNMLIKLLEEEKSFEEFSRIVDIVCKNGKLIKSVDNIYYYYKVEDPKTIVDAHKKSPLEYLNLDIKIIYTFGMEDAFNYNDSNYAFYEFLVNNHKMLPLDAEALVSECVFKINNGYTNQEVVNFLNTSLEIDILDEKTVINHIDALAQNNPLWTLKGNAKSDILKALGRNDECFCGSGKKYKKCCEGR